MTGEEQRRTVADRLGVALGRSLGALAGFLLAALAMITFLDVVGRYVFNAPITGAYEIVQFLMAGVVAAAMPVVTYRRIHVTIDLLDPLLPYAVRRVQSVVVDAVCAVVLSGVAWRLWLLGVEKQEYGDVTVFLALPIHPLAFAIAVILGVAALSSFALMILALLPGARQGGGSLEHRQ